METNQILEADVLDIIFEGKNKMYGAYVLRKTYNKRLTTALIAMVGGCLFTFLAFFAGNSGDHQHAALVVSDVVNLTEVKPMKPPVIPPPLPAAPKPIATTKFSTPKLTNEPIEMLPPKQTDMDNVIISTINKKGALSDAIEPPIEEQGITKEAPQIIEDYNKIFKSVQIQAQFPGGTDAWKRFLERNLKADLPAENGAPSGTYTVVVSFLVNKEGNISEVKAENDPGYGTAAEAVRVIQNGPKWIPALQNGRNVIYRQMQTITFKVEEV